MPSFSTDSPKRATYNGESFRMPDAWNTTRTAIGSIELTAVPKSKDSTTFTRHVPSSSARPYTARPVTNVATSRNSCSQNNWRQGDADEDAVAEGKVVHPGHLQERPPKNAHKDCSPGLWDQSHIVSAQDASQCEGRNQKKNNDADSHVLPDGVLLHVAPFQVEIRGFVTADLNVSRAPAKFIIEVIDVCAKILIRPPEDLLDVRASLFDTSLGRRAKDITASRRSLLGSSQGVKPPLWTSFPSPKPQNQREDGGYLDCGEG
eukprot:scaffold7513_cov296-Pinguiococcus_pyrenoidosus.AAC.8